MSGPYTLEYLNQLNREKIVHLANQHGWPNASVHKTDVIKKFLLGTHPTMTATSDANNQPYKNHPNNIDSPINPPASDDETDFYPKNILVNDSNIIIPRLTQDQLSKILHVYRHLKEISKCNIPIDLKYANEKLISELPVHFGGYSNFFDMQPIINYSLPPQVPLQKQYKGSFNPYKLIKKKFPLDNKRLQLIYNIKNDPMEIFQNLKKASIHLCKYIIISKDDKTLILLEASKRYESTNPRYFDISLNNVDISVRPEIYSIKKGEWEDAINFYKLHNPIIDNFN